MSVRKNAVVVKLAALLLAAALPATARGQNHHDHDVDVEVVNTPNVKVVNTPSVNVNNLPAVQLAPGAAVSLSGTPTVQVVNTAASPVLVHDTATPNRTPFQFQPSFTIQDGSPVGGTTFNVPAGKRLVIEYVSASGVDDRGTLVYRITTEDSSANPIIHFLPAIQIVDIGGAKESIAGQAVKLYSEPGTQVEFEALRQGSTNVDSVAFSVSGYLEDVQ
jgi:hypothetical protein